MDSSRMLGFGSPDAVLTGGQSFSTAATDINSGFDQVTPPANTTGVPLTPATADPTMGGPSGFNLPGMAAQNIITDPNVVGLMTPGMTTYTPDSLTRPSGGMVGLTGMSSMGGGGLNGGTDGTY